MNKNLIKLVTATLMFTCVVAPVTATTTTIIAEAASGAMWIRDLASDFNVSIRWDGVNDEVVIGGMQFSQNDLIEFGAYNKKGRLYMTSTQFKDFLDYYRIDYSE